MKKLLLIFVVVLFSCSDNSNESEPTKRIAYLNFENRTGGRLIVNEISFDSYKYVINSDSRTIEVDLEKLYGLNGNNITLIGQAYGNTRWEETVNAIFREDVITNLIAGWSPYNGLYVDVTYE